MSEAETEAEAESETKAKPKSGWLNVAVDYGPLLVFLGVYRWFAPEESNAAGEIVAIVYGTGAFMASAIAALIFSKWKFGRISPMLWFSTALIVLFGAFTIWTGEQWVIQVKPTVLYLIFGAILFGGWLRGRAFLQVLLKAAFEGLSDEGWLKLSRNWGFFFFFLALLNEAMRFHFDFGTWLALKLPVFGGLSFIFTFSQIPMLLKHGLSLEGVDEETHNPPPTT
jgi:intracellular septation protein